MAAAMYLFATLSLLGAILLVIYRKVLSAEQR
jgi:hypothetical protein